MQPALVSYRGQLAKAMARIEAEVLEGLQHGHFEISISCSITNCKVRDLVVKAGKNHRYRIAEDELERLN